MDHKEQHHQHHEKEREEKKKEHKDFEEKQQASTLPFHPLWLLVLGVVLVGGAVLVWILAF